MALGPMLDFKRMRNAATGFAEDKRGGVAVLFAGASLAILTLIAGSVEMHQRSLGGAELQKAVDAAALAAKRAETDALVSMSHADARRAGEAAGLKIFTAAISESSVFDIIKPTATYGWLKDGSSEVKAKAKLTTLFSGFVGDAFAETEASSTANFSVPLPTEVALVLDNTASMFERDGRPQTRFTQLRDASKLFTHQLFNAAEQSGSKDWLRLSVVPWAATVNVLSEAPRAADTSGNTPVTSIADYGTKKAVASPLQRGGRVIVNQADFAPVGWRGCISGQGEATGASEASGMTWKALSVPNNNPLDQVTIYQGKMVPKQYRYCTYKQESYECPPPPPPPTSSYSTSSSYSSTSYSSTSSYSTSSTSTTSSSTSSTSTTSTTSTTGGMQGFLDELKTVETPVEQAALFGDRFKDADILKPPVQKVDTCYRSVEDKCWYETVQELSCEGIPPKTYASCQQDIKAGRRNVYSASPIVCADSTQNGVCLLAGTERTTNVGPCVGDPNEWGWKGSWCPWVPPTNWTKFDATIGPNLNCPVPMLGLSGNRKQVIETLDRMTPVSGGTHTDVGLRWGMRSLSPVGDWPSFFGLTKEPAKWKGEETKMMILITDGENQQAVDYPGYWGCKGYINPGCTGSPDQAELDRRTLQWCNFVKMEKKIDLFVIAVNFSKPAAIQLLQTCAGPAKQNVARFYRIDAAELKNVMKIIAGQVVKLRITS